MKQDGYVFARERIGQMRAEREQEVEHLLRSGFLSTDPNAPGELCEHLGTWDSLEEAEEFIAEFFAKGYYDTKNYGRVYTDPNLYEKETGRKLTPSDRRHFGMKELIHEQEVEVVEPNEPEIDTTGWYKYYVTFHTQNDKGSGFGSSTMLSRNKIETEDDVERMKENIEKKAGFNANVVIINWRYFKEQDQ